MPGLFSSLAECADKSSFVFLLAKARSMKEENNNLHLYLPLLSVPKTFPAEGADFHPNEARKGRITFQLFQ